MEKVQLTQEEVDALGFAVKARLMSIESGITYENRHELENDSEYLALLSLVKKFNLGD